MLVAGFLAAAPSLAAEVEDGGVVAGLVRLSDGTPVDEIDLVLRAAVGSRVWKATVGEDGRFSFDGLPIGSYALTLVRGLGGLGERVMKTVSVRRLGETFSSEFLVVIWDEEERTADRENLWEELKHALRSAPRDGLRQVANAAPVADDLAPIIEETEGSHSRIPTTFDPSGDLLIAQSVSLTEGSPAFRGLNAGFSFDHDILRLGNVSVAGYHNRGGSLTSPQLIGPGVQAQEIAIGVDLAASDVDVVSIDAAVGRDVLQTSELIGDRYEERIDENIVSSFETFWNRRMADGDLDVRVSYARGALTMSGLPLTVNTVQSFWSAHGNFTFSSVPDHQITIGGAFRRDRAPGSYAAWPGAYDDVAGLIASTNTHGAADAYVRDVWEMNRAITLRYGVSMFHPLSDGFDRSFVSPEAGVDLRLWKDGKLGVSAAYVYSPDPEPTTLAADEVRDPDFIAFMAELDQRLPSGARIVTFFGTRDLRTLFMQATAGEPVGSLPSPLFYTTGYASAKEAGLRISSAPVGADAVLTLSYLHGRTDGSLSVQPLAYLRRDIALGAQELEHTRVGYSQALLGIVVPHAGTAFDFSYMTVKAKDRDEGEEEAGYSLWGGQVRQDVPFLAFSDARVAVLLAANQVLADLYRLEAMANTNRQLQVSGGIALTF